MWKKFNEMMARPLAGVITNSVAALVWLLLCLTSNGALRVICGFDAVIFAFAAGARLQEHVARPLLEMRADLIERQHEMILELIQENTALAEGVEEDLAGNQFPEN